MPKFGTSEGQVYGASGAPLKILEETAEVCTVCEDSMDGGCNYGIIRENNNTATLICPNCGTEKTVFSNEVIRKDPKAKTETRK